MSWATIWRPALSACSHTSRFADRIQDSSAMSTGLASKPGGTAYASTRVISGKMAVSRRTSIDLRAAERQGISSRSKVDDLLPIVGRAALATPIITLVLEIEMIYNVGSASRIDPSGRTGNA